MKMRSRILPLRALLLIACILFLPSRAPADSAPAEVWTVASASEVKGKLHIVLRNGRDVTVPPQKDQCSFDSIKIAPDGRTVGWTESYTAHDQREPPCKEGVQTAGFGPILWRDGKIIRRLAEGGGDVDWVFYGKRNLIAVHAGPAHFDDEQGCVLLDIATGHVLKTWRRSDKTDPPDWAAGLIDG